MRSDSGVTPLTIFTKPWPCGGTCLYCPEVDGLPNSYLPRVNVSHIANKFSSYTQTLYWLDKISSRGGVTAKIEVIILGGSFTALPYDYIKTFISGVYHAIEGVPNDTYPLEKIIVKHEQSLAPRVIGITIETRPDLVNTKQIKQLFKYGVTKVELGIQHLNENILEFNDRRQPKSVVYDAVSIIKNSGLKIGFHILFGLPKSSLNIDEEMFDQLFQEDELQPDHLKIYFCELFKKKFMRSRMVDLFDRQKWKPLTKSERQNLLLKILPKIPMNVRVSRIGRKVSKQDIEEIPISISRVYIEKKAGCRCIRCREPIRKAVANKNIDRQKIITKAITDKEIYIEATDELNTCYGFLRLRYLGKGKAIIRELHVYGLESKSGYYGNLQHNGIGKSLLQQAEKQASQLWSTNHLAVASGIGAKSYYKKCGYSDDRFGYMQKVLNLKEGGD